MERNNYFREQSNICPGTEQLLRYAREEATSDEMNKIERHLDFCEMCSAELEGLLLLENPADIKKISENLNQEIDKILAGKKTKKYNLTYYRWIAAASFFILIGGIYFVLQTMFAVDRQMETARKETIKRIKITNKEAVKYECTREIPIETISYLPNLQYEEAQSEEILIADEKDYVALASGETIKSESEDLKKVSDEIVAYDKLLKFEEYKQKTDKKEKSVECAKISVAGGTNKDIENAPNTGIDEKTLWDKALKLIKEDKPKEARKILRQLIEMHGSYEDSAKNKLKEL